MGQGFKEVANLRTNVKKFEEGFSKIDWSGSTSGKENHIVNSLSKSKEVVYSGSIYINDGDYELTHTVDLDSSLKIVVKDNKQNKTFDIMPVMFSEKEKTDNEIINDVIIGMYFEILHRDTMLELESNHE